MKLTNEQVRVIFETLYEIKDKQMPAVTAYAIASNMHVLEPHYEALMQCRTSIGLKYGEPQDNGMINVKEENIVDANKELQELLNVENEVNILPIDINRLDSIELTPATMINLMPIVEMVG